MGRCLALLASLWLGCASAYPSVQVEPPPSEDPAEGLAFRVRVLTDERTWLTVPDNSLVPSLVGIDPDDEAQVSRVIGRYRSASGQLLRNVLLDESQSVQELTVLAVTRGFRLAGYRVLVPGDDGYTEALPIDLSIRRFWVRMETQRPGVSWAFSAEIGLRAPAPPFIGGAWVCGDSFVARGGPSPGAWGRTVALGLDELSGRIHGRLAAGTLLPYC